MAKATSQSTIVKPPQRLTCEGCGRIWERKPTGGHKPRLCPDCPRATQRRSRRYISRSEERGARDRTCCACSASFTLAKREHGDKKWNLCHDCRLTYGMCRKCETLKPVDAFAIASHRAGKRQDYCKECTRKEYHARDRTHLIAARYGLTLDEWHAMANGQAHRCAICGRHESDLGSKGLVVDHCHATGRVRALLCGPCNVGIGLFAEDSNRVRLAAAYLDSHIT